MKPVFQQLLQDLKLKWIVIRSVDVPKVTNLLATQFSQHSMRNSNFCRENLFPNTYLKRHFCCPVEDLPLQIPTHCKDRVHPAPLYSLVSFDAINKPSKHLHKERILFHQHEAPLDLIC